MRRTQRQGSPNQASGRGLTSGLLLVAAAAATLFATTARVQALGFSDIEQVSAIGEPLDVRLVASGLDEDFNPRRIRIASPATYERMGLQWPALLDAAVVDVNADGSSARIRIRTAARVRDPLISLVLEGLDVHGTVRREYTLLLDPPAAAQPATSLRMGPAAVTGTPAAPPMRAETAPAPPPAAKPTVSKPAPAKLPVEKAAKHDAARTAKSARVTAKPAAPPAAKAASSSTPRGRPLKLQLIGKLGLTPNLFTEEAPSGLKLQERISAEHLKALPPLARPPAATVGTAPSDAPAVAAAAAAPLAAKPEGGWSWLHWLLAAALGVILLQAWALWRRREAAYYLPVEEDTPPPAPAPAAASTPVVARKPAVIAAPAASPAAAATPPPAPERETIAPIRIAGLVSERSEAVPAMEQRQVLTLKLPVMSGAANEEPAAAAEGEDVLDPSGEAFGSDSEVSRVLREALRYAPQRQDLRYKLLEMAYNQGQAAPFIEHAHAYEHHRGDADDPAWDHVIDMGLQLAPGEPLFTQAVDHRSQRQARHYDRLEHLGLSRELLALKEAYSALDDYSAFSRALTKMYLREAERPTMLSHARRLSEEIGGAQILIKREDLRAARESQRINAYGQVLLAKHLGRQRVVSATRSGVHGEAVARAAHSIGLPLRMYLPQALLEDHSHPSVRLMRTLDAQLVGLPEGDTRRAALQDWLGAPQEAFYVTGLDAGPPPYPAIVVDLQAVIGEEVLQQARPLAPEGVHACVCAQGAGAAAMGFLQPLMDYDDTALYYVESEAPAITGEHLHRFTREQSWMRSSGRVQQVTVSMTEVYHAAQRGAELEGFPQDACNAATLAQVMRIAATLPRSRVVVGLFVNPLETQVAMRDKAA